jgi:hypothetical protein
MVERVAQQVREKLKKKKKNVGEKAMSLELVRMKFVCFFNFTEINQYR